MVDLANVTDPPPGGVASGDFIPLVRPGTIAVIYRAPPVTQGLKGDKGDPGTAEATATVPALADATLADGLLAALFTSDNTAVKTTLAALRAYFTQGLGPPVLTLTMPTGILAGTSFTVAGTFTNDGTNPVLSLSIDSGAFAALPTGSTATGGVISLHMPGLSEGQHTLQVRDGNSVLSNTVYFVVTISETLTIANPGPQTAGVAFTLSGTYAMGVPPSLDYSVNGGSVWYAATSPTISGGNYSFGGVTVPGANPTQVVKVRDHQYQSVAASSAAFVVAAPTAAVPPGLVQNLYSGNPATTSIPVAYDAPSTGTAPITYSGRTITGGGAAVNNTGTFTNISGQFTGLTPGTVYTLQVVATNAAGVSVTTLSHTITTAGTAPSAPAYTFTAKSFPSNLTVNSAGFELTFNGFLPDGTAMNSANQPAGVTFAFVWHTSGTVAPTTKTILWFDNVTYNGAGYALAYYVHSSDYSGQGYPFQFSTSGTTLYPWVISSDGRNFCITSSAFVLG